MENINTPEYWNNVYKHEEEWRLYPNTFEMISNVVGSKQRVIEFGCGTGILAYILAENKNNVIGLDISTQACFKYNKRNMTSEAVAYQANLLIMPSVNVPSGTIAVASEFLEHFTDEELNIIMPKIKYAAPKAIFCVPNDCLDNDQCDEHYQRFTKDSLRSFLSKYYNKVLVIDFIDQFNSYKGLVRLPVLMAVCEGKSE